MYHVNMADCACNHLIGGSNCQCCCCSWFKNLKPLQCKVFARENDDCIPTQWISQIVILLDCMFRCSEAAVHKPRITQSLVEGDMLHLQE